MTNFEAAVELSLNNWVASFPTEFDLPKPTQEYEKGIAKLFDKMRGDRYHRFTKNTARIILIAAILLAIATVTLAATVGREFIVQKFSDFSTYSVINNSDVEKVYDIEIGYMPEGFELEKNYITDNYKACGYSNDTKWINIYKTKIDSKIEFDTEYKNKDSVIINGYDGVYYSDASDFNGIVWNNGYFIYRIQGNISKDELIKIAENTT